jgi:maltodextrin utilization protein YvdJ
MKMYANKRIQTAFTLLYPVIIFWLLSIGHTLNSWLIPAIVTLLFCLLWGNLRYLFVSNMLMWIISVPVWWIIESGKEGQGAVIFAASLPFIVLAFVGIVLLPEVLIVTIRNDILKKFGSGQ